LPTNAHRNKASTEQKKLAKVKLRRKVGARTKQRPEGRVRRKLEPARGKEGVAPKRILKKTTLLRKRGGVKRQILDLGGPKKKRELGGDGWIPA